MKLRPLQDRVIVKPSDAEEKTASGILLPDTAKEKPTKGKVIAVGPGKLDDKGRRMDIPVRNGDSVYYGKYSGTEIEVDGEKFVILRETDVLGVVEEELMATASRKSVKFSPREMKSDLPAELDFTKLKAFGRGPRAVGVAARRSLLRRTIKRKAG